jgi:predicted transcriptional regulator
MDVQFSPEFENKLKRAAAEIGRGPEQLVQEIVQSYLEHDLWFKAEVKKGLDQLDRGEFIEHDEVVARIEQMFRS